MAAHLRLHWGEEANQLQKWKLFNRKYAITTVIQNRKYVTINYSGRAAFGLVAWGRQTKHLNSISIYVLFPSYKYPHFIRTQLPTLHIMSRWSGFKKCGHRYAMAV